MKLVLSMILLGAAFAAQPAQALIYKVQFSGELATKQLFNPLGSADDLDVGDKVKASFNFDTDQAHSGASISLLGGIETIYAAILHNYKLTIGGFNFEQDELPASLYVFDNVADADAFGFDYTKSLVTLPFGSDLLATQFQARADNKMLDNTLIENGLPFHYPDWTIFASFSAGTSRYAFRGPLSVSVTTIPEPTSLALFGLGLSVLGFSKRRKAN